MRQITPPRPLLSPAGWTSLGPVECVWAGVCVVFEPGLGSLAWAARLVRRHARLGGHTSPLSLREATRGVGVLFQRDPRRSADQPDAAHDQAYATL